MAWFLILIACTCAIAGSAVALAVRKASPKNAHPVTAEWIEELSVSRYEPMLRLLDEREVRALERRADAGPDRVAQFRCQRTRMFREHLKWLHGDFASICLAVKLLMLQSQIDRPDLAATLVRARIGFVIGIIEVQARLVLYELGIGNVDVRGLFTLFETMRLELRSLTPESAVWGS